MADVSELMRLHPEVEQALAAGDPIVALESTLVTHGLPHPDNLRTAQGAEAAVRSAGAIPATVAIRDGRILVGLAPAELEDLATAADATKVSRQNLAGMLGRAGWGGTTVAATMLAAHLAGIRVFATGGIGGVHLGAESSMDISADLDELARTPVAVVSAGPKSILDVGRTLQALETRGVPVAAWQSDDVAGFYSRSSGFPAPLRVDSPDEAAALIDRQEQLGLGGVLITVPLPEALAMSRESVAEAVKTAEAEATVAGISGPASTPFLLQRVAELSSGASVRANVALIEQNAAVAATISVALATRDGAAG